MKFFTFSNKCLFVFITSTLSLYCAASDVEFSVISSRDRMEVHSVFSKDAAYFTSKGSYQVGIYARNPYMRTGSICCHKGYKTEEFFLKSEEGENRILQLKWSSSEHIEGPTLSVFDVKGKLIAGPTKPLKLQNQLIAVSPTKSHFVALGPNNISIFDSDLKITKEYFASSGLKNSEAIAISSNADAALIKHATSLTYVDLRLNREIEVASCAISEYQGFKITAFENVSDSIFFFVSQGGSACVIKGGEAKSFRASFTGKLLAAYAASDNLYILTSDSLTTFDSENFIKNGLFELNHYYENQFGKDPAVRPFFSQSEFDSKYNKFFVRGGGNSGKLFEIKQIKN